MTQQTAEMIVAKQGRKPKQKPEDPLDELGQTKVRKRLIGWGKHVAQHRGVDLWEYFDSILAPIVERDVHQTGLEIAKETKARKPTTKPASDEP